MLQLEEARKKILEKIQPLGSEIIPLPTSFQRVLAEEIMAPVDLPPFDNSAMDGYAVQSKDLILARADSPISLRLIGKIAAGEFISSPLKIGTCVRIFTGSPLPPGADAVVMQEEISLESAHPEKIFFHENVRPGENIRHRGEDVRKNSVLLQAGCRLTAGRITLLAAAGIKTVRVGCQPLVGLLATGSELLEAGQPLSPGKIYESNRTGLAVLIRQVGAIPKIYPLVPDDFASTKIALEKAFAECDLVLTSGGVSVGEFDFVKIAFEKFGGALSFWKIAMKPGKPFVFGQWREKFLFGLPGNPISALVTFLLLGRAALLALQGASELLLPCSGGFLAEALINNGERPHFMRVKMDRDGQVVSAGIQASHILSALAGANGLVEVPAQTTFPVGKKVAVLQWE